MENPLQLRNESQLMQVEFTSFQPRMYRCCCRRRFPLQRENNPLFRAVLSDNLAELQTLVESGHRVNTKNAKGCSLLNFAMRRKRVEIFDYLLSLDQIDVDYRDRMHQSPLLYLAGVCFDEYFALELLKKGADVNLTDDSGFSFLHLAARAYCDDNLRVGQLVIDKGADVDLRGHYGVTPLYAACEEGNFDWVSMLLYYGADPMVPTHRKILPVAVVASNANQDEEQQTLLQEIIFNHTFDNDKICLSLPTLTAAMTLSSDLFVKILDKASSVEYDLSDLQHLVTSLIHVKAQHLELFMQNFGFIIKDMIDNFPPLEVLIKISLDCEMSGLRDIVQVFLDSEYCAEFVQSCDPTLPAISRLIQEFTIEEEEKFTQMVCLMLTYGLGVTSTDLDAVYNQYGYCELFKLLLHMAVTLTNNCNNVHSIAALYYNPNLSLDDFLNDFSINSHLLHFYNHRKLKEICLDVIEDGEKLPELPQVPYLLELSRNAARNFIVSKFKIRNCSQFYTVLRWLPIGEMNKKIIALEKKIYE
ncbi:ankyrin-3 isoform X1 [Tribolium castaneum]|uniref:Uncharacterized protein n=1 Tax=Tribolium castaneum TaxID=7070 RepID=A0A139WE56_TRICA|nr:PREDICTED: ankyrin-3 isoform X1 [Tribolium castaneum]KYB26121.1 hypothetical protein TcasGA2_TC033981 [Tribolium castaneum]|eukprot:XP_008196203.1 PREDICTED: ankyrin-3 isoform X1 [Tribolium castaneum]